MEGSKPLMSTSYSILEQLRSFPWSMISQGNITSGARIIPQLWRPSNLFVTQRKRGSPTLKPHLGYRCTLRFQRPGNRRRQRIGLAARYSTVCHSGLFACTFRSVSTTATDCLLTHHRGRVMVLSQKHLSALLLSTCIISHFT